MSAIRIAFLILAHQDALQVEHFTRALPGHQIFVCVDGRAADFSLDRIAALHGKSRSSSQLSVQGQLFHA
jgi:hypothetical protein